MSIMLDALLKVDLLWPSNDGDGSSSQVPSRAARPGNDIMYEQIFQRKEVLASDGSFEDRILSMQKALEPLGPSSHEKKKPTKSGPIFPTSCAYFLRSALTDGELVVISDSQSLL